MQPLDLPEIVKVCWLNLVLNDERRLELNFTYETLSFIHILSSVCVLVFCSRMEEGGDRHVFS